MNKGPALLYALRDEFLKPLRTKQASPEAPQTGRYLKFGTIWAAEVRAGIRSLDCALTLQALVLTLGVHRQPSLLHACHSDPAGTSRQSRGSEELKSWFFLIWAL